MKNILAKFLSVLMIIAIMMQFTVVSIATTKFQLKSQQSTLNSKIKEKNYFKQSKHKLKLQKF